LGFIKGKYLNSALFSIPLKIGYKTKSIGAGSDVCSVFLSLVGTGNVGPGIIITCLEYMAYNDMIKK
jgi:hypothetical protein